MKFVDLNKLIKSSFKISIIEIKERYIRSVIGPFWITLSMFFVILSIGIVFNYLFQQNISDFIPYLAIGLIIWSFIQACFTEATKILKDNYSIMNNQNVNLNFFVLRVIFRNLIILLHHLIIIIFIFFYFSLKLNFFILILPLSILVTLFFLFYLIKIITIISARYNDMEQVIVSILTFAFYLTPIIWKKKFLIEYEYLLNFNIFYHLINIFRAPLLNEDNYFLSLIVIISTTFLIYLLNKFKFKKYEKKIIFWI